MGRGGGQVVSVLAFYSIDPSSNPADVYSFFCKICIWKKQKNILEQLLSTLGSIWISSHLSRQKSSFNIC